MIDYGNCTHIFDEVIVYKPNLMLNQWRLRQCNLEVKSVDADEPIYRTQIPPYPTQLPTLPPTYLA